MSVDATAPPVPDRRLGTAAEPDRRPDHPRGTDYYLLADLLTDEEREIRDRVRNFVDTEVLPIINDYWERAQFPFELVPKIAAAGRGRRPDPGLRLPRPVPARGRHGDPGDCPAATAASTPSSACRTAWRWARSTCSAPRSRSSGGCRQWPGWTRSARSRSPNPVTAPIPSGWKPPRAATATTGCSTAPSGGSATATSPHVVIVWARDVADGKVKGFVVEKDDAG